MHVMVAVLLLHFVVWIGLSVLCMHCMVQVENLFVLRTGVSSSVGVCEPSAGMILVPASLPCCFIRKRAHN